MQLGDGGLGVGAYVSQHNQAKQAHVDGSGLHLLLCHVHQVQLGSSGDHSNCHGQQAEAFAAVIIHHLYNQGALTTTMTVGNTTLMRMMVKQAGMILIQSKQSQSQLRCHRFPAHAEQDTSRASLVFLHPLTSLYSCMAGVIGAAVADISMDTLSEVDKHARSSFANKPEAGSLSDVC